MHVMNPPVRVTERVPPAWETYRGGGISPARVSKVRRARLINFAAAARGHSAKAAEGGRRVALDETRAAVAQKATSRDDAAHVVGLAYRHEDRRPVHHVIVRRTDSSLVN